MMSDSTRDTDVPGPSKAEGSEPDSNSQIIKDSKMELKELIVYCEKLLPENNKIATEPPAVIKEEPMEIGELPTEDHMAVEDNLIMFEESDEEGPFEEAEASASQSDDEYYPDEKRSKIDRNNIPLDYKIKVINLAKKHPKWGLKTLQSHGGSRLKRMDQLRIWEEQVKKGGSMIDKYTTIDKWTHDRFVEARQSKQQVTTRNLQQWALAAASQFPDLEFKASEAWILTFKRRHRIRHKQMRKFVSERETTTMEETLAAAEKFRLHARALIPNYDKDLVINTDQTECQYQSSYNRTLAEQAKCKKDMNKGTHSHTAQYAMTLSGKLLPTVFVCLQEATGKFGPKVQKLVDAYAEIYTNVAITSSKSGKLTTPLYKDFLIDVIKPYVKKEKFLFLIGSEGGHETNPVLHDEIFTDEEGTPTCAIKVIPPKCTSLVQPCDVYFYRQVNNFIERLQNWAHIIEQDRKITSREDCIKIQALVHHQLSAPIFCSMLKYAWFAAKLCDDKTSFVNVDQVCFAIDVLKNPCECKNTAFITCSRCRINYCFPCFYDRYHPNSCSDSSIIKQHDSE